MNLVEVNPLFAPINRVLFPALVLLSTVACSADDSFVKVVKVDIVEQGCATYGNRSRCAGLHLSADSSSNVTWTIVPSLSTGAQFAASANAGSLLGTSSTGTNVWLFAGNALTNYTIKVSDNIRTDACDSVNFRVRFLNDNPTGDPILEFSRTSGTF